MRLLRFGVDESVVAKPPKHVQIGVFPAVYVPCEKPGKSLKISTERA
jgi:hypothetical protein